ncbi:hydroxyphenylacetyl-CoA thioesterase PaaI [Amphritea sp. HPY]|uniref:hydroxyphenylacetyl-CoA thioesterase PaaI n=1 Tax=Amphritea sp. HPY TaxID=3421652 RepID=UPI003D7C9E5B
MLVENMTPQQLAEACSAVLHERDYAAQGMDINIDEVAPGYAKLSMQVRKDMLNGYAMSHGGFMFALCDTAFAHSCNTYNKVTVASGCTIDFVAPGFEGDTLTAIAKERTRSGRTGVYDITLYNQKDEELGYFRGKSYQIKGSVIPE